MGAAAGKGEGAYDAAQAQPTRLAPSSGASSRCKDPSVLLVKTLALSNICAGVCSFIRRAQRPQLKL
eukprot:298455-Pelagomonas_calceolata.AAC.1